MTCSRTVCIVEDDHDVLEIVIDILKDNAYQTIAAVNGRDALEKLRAAGSPPCVILLDIMMPIMDGWRFREVQSQDPALSDIPVVVVSAHTNAQDVAKAMTAAGFLKKPLHIAALLATVSRFCNEQVP